MTPEERTRTALKLAIEILPTLTWRRVPDKELPAELRASNLAARAFEGTGGGATCTVASFSIEDQGFAPGSRGYDGAMIVGNPPTVLRLTRDLAQRAVELAEAAQPKA